MDIQIYVISHLLDDIEKTRNDFIYTPLFVGRNGRDNFGYCSDDNGDNISSKNPYFCELTGLYWIWKQSKADIIGLCHYRRYFVNEKDNLLEKDEIESILSDYDLIIPYFGTSLLENVYEDYDNEHYGKDLDLCRDLIERMTPEYLDSYDKVIYGNKLCHYNMFIAKKEIIDGYCEWVFPILFELEKEINAKDYDDYRKRSMAF